MSPNWLTEWQTCWLTDWLTCWVMSFHLCIHFSFSSSFFSMPPWTQSISYDDHHHHQQHGHGYDYNHIDVSLNVLVTNYIKPAGLSLTWLGVVSTRKVLIDEWHILKKSKTLTGLRACSCVNRTNKYRTQTYRHFLIDDNLTKVECIYYERNLDWVIAQHVSILESWHANRMTSMIIASSLLCILNFISQGVFVSLESEHCQLIPIALKYIFDRRRGSQGHTCEQQLTLWTEVISGHARALVSQVFDVPLLC